jgi:hypothetical protein
VAAGILNDHLKTLAKYPPIQAGAAFNMSNSVAEFLQRMRL